MGGLAIEIPRNLPESKKFLPTDANQTWFLTVEAISHVMECDKEWSNVFPNLSEENIKSKSKANGLAKALVCIQALWFVAQCFSRCMSRIPRKYHLNSRETYSDISVQSHNGFPSAY